MKKLLSIIFIVLFNFVNAQEIPTTYTLEIDSKYQFRPYIDIEASSIKSQDKTGTCWSFSTSSFLESEIYRLTGKKIDISEMYSVRGTYERKAWNYVMRQGKAQFGEGGLGHDVINSLKTDGLVPESEFSGLIGNQTTHSHSQMVKEIQTILDAYIKNDIDSPYPNWKQTVDELLNENLGTEVNEFVFEGKVYTPKSFLEMTTINPNDYISITSFTHIPFYENFILNIPDNFSNGTYYNVPLDEFNSIAKQVLENGFSIEWDGDVSEKTFSPKYGIAVLPSNIENNTKSLTEIVPEMDVTQEFRQQEFENYNTGDDHLMHIIGIVTDQNGKLYYKIKNSWGTNSNRIGNDGYIYMSESYFKLKSISILIHKNALTQDLKQKLNL
ncbi:C1 family peptidase [Urechidicola croceus]|uniref:Aminopeptidase n=1 Tax=Urechidicola croceus TaxID=1850246 RepID=A0A1D8P3U5_9FLAO|nr:C1 family peptidase [Urechidicola croceus]AOW19253.1 aminopeptidase [Urechidicola croceus]